jgi:hypothetical protein
MTRGWLIEPAAYDDPSKKNHLLDLVRQGALRWFAPVSRDGRVAVGAENSDTPCDAHVLVDEAAETIASQRLDNRPAWGSAIGGRLLLE